MNEEIAASCVFRFAAKNYNPLRNAWQFARPGVVGGRDGSLAADPSTRVEPVRVCNIGMKKVIQSAGRNGVLKSFQSVQGSPESHVQFTDAPLREYTLFHLCRYQHPPQQLSHPPQRQYARGRILNSVDGDWFSGFWKGHEGVSFRGDDWLVAPPRVEEEEVVARGRRGVPASEPAWLLSTDCPHRYRRNGKAMVGGEAKKTEEADEAEADGDPLPPFGINFPASVPWERSHFEVADVILYDRVLPLAEIERVEAFLACEYGIREMM